MMRIFNKHIYTVLLGMLLMASACDTPFELNTEQASTQLVIEGLVTDADTVHYVRVMQTKGFGTDGSAPNVDNATVEVSDNEGNSYTYVHNNTGNSDYDGYYFSTNPYTGKVGNTYTMTVLYEGNTYTGSDELLRVTEIDSLAVRLADKGNLDDDLDSDEIYEVLFYAKEPQDTDDYYLFKYYKNGKLIKDEETDIYFAEDTYVGEDIFDIKTAGYFAENDIVTVEFYSLSRNAFVYYTDLYNVLNNDGGMFGAVPSNPRTTLTGGALGYFQASSTRRRSIIVKDPE